MLGGKLIESQVRKSVYFPSVIQLGNSSDSMSGPKLVVLLHGEVLLAGGPFLILFNQECTD